MGNSKGAASGGWRSDGARDNIGRPNWADGRIRRRKSFAVCAVPNRANHCNKATIRIISHRSGYRFAIAVALVLTGVLWPGLDRTGSAAAQGSARRESAEGTSSEMARQDALRSIPWERLSPAGRAKAEAVVANQSIFRRLPTKTIDCDPDFYLFLVRHPDVVVNIWEALKISQVQLRQVRANSFQLTEPGGTAISLEFLYRSRELHVIYGEGAYQGPVLSRPLVGRGLVIMKTRYAQQPNGRWHITTRLDSFTAIEPIAAELFTKTISPLLGKTADHNFTQTAAFVGSLSRTAEVNARSVRRLAAQLNHVQPEVRAGFADLAAAIARNSAPPDKANNAATHPAKPSRDSDLAGRSEDRVER
jgi:hypothetical protein